MRIQDDDTNEYITPQEKYVPGQRVELIKYEREEEKLAVEPVRANGQTEAEPKSGIFSQMSLDLNLAKFVAIGALFVFMFVIPAALNDGVLRLPNFERNSVYTQSVISQTTANQNGRVAGASDTQTGDVDSRNELLQRITGREIFGVSLGVIFIIIGILLVVLPLLILVA